GHRLSLPTSPTAGWCHTTRGGATMTGGVPPSLSFRDPMADPSGGWCSDVATDPYLVEYLVVVVPDLGSLKTVTPALADLVASAALRILDLLCVHNTPTER